MTINLGSNGIPIGSCEPTSGGGGGGGTGTGLSVQIVDALPDVGEEGILYLVPSITPQGTNIFVEYIWLASEGTYEELGDTSVVPENITTQGNEFNLANQLVQLDSEGALPSLDGSRLFNMDCYTEAETDLLLSGKQDSFDLLNPLVMDSYVYDAREHINPISEDTFSRSNAGGYAAYAIPRIIYNGGTGNFSIENIPGSVLTSYKISLDMDNSIVASFNPNTDTIQTLLYDPDEGSWRNYGILLGKIDKNVFAPKFAITAYDYGTSGRQIAIRSINDRTYSDTKEGVDASTKKSGEKQININIPYDYWGKGVWTKRISFENATNTNITMNVSAYNINTGEIYAPNGSSITFPISMSDVNCVVFSSWAGKTSYYSDYMILDKVTNAEKWSLKNDSSKTINNTLQLTYVEPLILSDNSLTVAPATTSTLGGVKPDGTTITITDDGTISSVGGGGGATSDRHGIKGDYATRYGIIDCPNGLITYTTATKDVQVQPGIVLLAAGNDTKTTIASEIDYTITGSEDVTLFYAEGEILEVHSHDVFYQEEEPENGETGFLAWWNPNETVNSAKQWQFKSNDTGNVWRSLSATPVANVKITDDVIVRIDFVGYRILDDECFALNSEAVITGYSEDSSEYWYREYSDGWIEQGGLYVHMTSENTGVISITQPMSVVNSISFGTMAAALDPSKPIGISITGVNKDSDNLVSSFQYVTDSSSMFSVFWTVRGRL